MIGESLGLLSPEALAAVAWSFACWVSGVGWAAYRAVSWVERIRSWATGAPDLSESDL